MSDNSKDALLARLAQGNVMNGWGAILALGRDPLEQLLQIRYLEGFGQSNFLPPISGSYFTDGQRNDEAVFDGLVLGPPKLSFAGASGGSPRVTVMMPFIAGEYQSYSRLVSQPPRLKSSHGLREEMGYHVQMTVGLQVVEDQTTNQAKLVLDLSDADEFISNLGESEVAYTAMGRFIQTQMARSEAFNHQFVLLSAELGGHDALSPRGLSVRTLAAPEGVQGSAGREGDGAAIILLDLRGRRFGGTWPVPGVFPYLLPDGSSGVTLLVDKLRVPLLDELAGNLARRLILPGALQVRLLEQHDPHDRALFGRLVAGQAARQIEPAMARLTPGQSLQFGVYGQPVSGWAANNISQPRSCGAIDAAGHYQGADLKHFARENQVILVTTQGEVAVRPALVVESTDAVEISPRVAVWRPGEYPIELTATGHGAWSWSLIPSLQGSRGAARSDNPDKPVFVAQGVTNHGELEDLGAGQARFTPHEPALMPEVLIQRIRVTDGFTGAHGEATVVIFAYMAVLNVLPFHVGKVPLVGPVTFELENDVADSWHLFGEGDIDTDLGVYTPPPSPQTPVAVVMADIRNRYAGYAVIELMREAAQVAMFAERYRNVLHFKLTPVPLNARNLYANGLQQVAVDIEIETEDFRNSDGDLVSDPVSDLELASLRILAQNGQPIDYLLQGAEGLDPELGQGWGWSKSRNRYAYYPGVGAGMAQRRAGDEGKRFLRVWLQTTEAETRKFHAEFQGHDRRWHNSRTISKEAGEVELTGRRPPVFAANNYRLEDPRRVAASGGKPVGQDTFNYYKYTTDYWDLTGTSQEYGNFRFYKADFDQLSLIRWESEQLAETFSSYTGLAFKPVPHPDAAPATQAMGYDAALQLLTLEPSIGYHGNLDYGLKAGEEVAEGALLLSLERVWDMPYWFDGMSPGGDYRSQLQGPMHFTLVDQYGNRHRLNVSFRPAGEPDSRNGLVLRLT